MDREEQIGRRGEQVQLLFKQQRIGAERHEFLARDDACNDLADLLVDQRLAAGNRHDRCAAFIDRVETVLDRQALVEDRVRIIDLAAADAGEVAAEQRLQHQHQRIALSAQSCCCTDRRRCAFLSETELSWHLRLSSGVARHAVVGKDRAVRPLSTPPAVGTRRFPHARTWSKFRPGATRPNASMTSSTRTSGADAPAVMPTTSASSHPFRLQLAAVGNQIARDAGLGADLAQAVGIRAVLRADHQDDIDLLAEFAHRGLAILRGVADVLGLGTDDIGEAPFQRCDDALGVVDAQRGLGDVGDRRVGRDIEASTSASVCTSTTGAEIWPMVPSTSGWPAWPIRMSVRPWPT